MNDLRTAAQQALEALTHGCPPDCTDGMTDSGGVHPWGEAVLVPCPTCTAIADLRAALAQQAEPLNLSDPAVRKRLASQWGYVPAAQAEPVGPVDVGLLEYRGNSVAFIHQKMTAYRTGIDAAWDAFRANGLHPDGKTPLADMIAKHTAPPQRTMVLLTEEEIDRATAQARDALLDHIYEYSTTTEGVLERIRNLCRAVEQASWEKNHGKA